MNRSHAATERELLDRLAAGGQAPFRAMAESSPNAMWIYDAKTLAFLWVNDAAVARYGYSREEFLAMRLVDVRPPEDVEGFLEHMQALGQDPNPGQLWRHRARDGTIIEVEVTGGPVSYAEHPARFAIVRDVTALLEARREAEQRARRLEALHAIDRGIIQAASIKDIARAALGHVRDLVPCDGLGLTLIDAATDTAMTFLWERPDPAALTEREPFELAPYRSILATLRSEGSYLIRDLRAEPDLPPILARLRDAGLVSVASVALLRADDLLGFLALYARHPGAFGVRETEVVREVADQLAIAITQVLLRRRERELAAERLRLLSDLVTAQEEERRRIAADLHDDVIQKVAALTMRLDMAVKRHPELAGDAQFARLRGVAADSIAALRTATFRLRPPRLDREGLGATLRAYLAEEIGDAPVAYSVEDRYEGRLEDPVRTALFRIAQEAIVNALKHAGASSLRVELREAAGGCVLRITDDGMGWDLRGRPESPAGHLGLTAMRERAESLGGWLRIQTRSGAGTTVECFAPVAP